MSEKMTREEAAQNILENLHNSTKKWSNPVHWKVPMAEWSTEKRTVFQLEVQFLHGQTRILEEEIV